MSVLVDTSVWSLALRRHTGENHPATVALSRLIREYRAVIAGVVRQELLSGLSEKSKFELLRKRLRAFPDVPIETEDHELGAEYYNQCRKRGIQGSGVDFLLCAIAIRRELPILTTDRDFDTFAKVLPLTVYPF